MTKTKPEKRRRPYPGLMQVRKQALKLLEKRYLISTLRKFKGHMAKAARAAKISKTSLYRYVNKHKIKPRSFRTRN